MKASDKVRITVAQYEIEQLPQWEAYEDKIVRLVEQAKLSEDTQLLTLGEYAGLELASWKKGSLTDQFNYIQSVLEDYKALFSSLAKDNQIYIQSGSLPVKESDGYFRNRAYLFSPQGEISYQDKIFMTRFEHETKLIKPGDELRVFETEIGKMGICIGYDCEFPQLAKQLTLSGVNLLLIPALTEKISGLTRVGTSSRARAIENQCYVAQSALVGKASWCDFIDINTGQSGIYSPADIGFPEDGILAIAQINTPMLIHTDLSWHKIQHVRDHGEMLNFNDMQQDIKPVSKAINTIKI